MAAQSIPGPPIQTPLAGPSASGISFAWLKWLQSVQAAISTPQNAPVESVFGRSGAVVAETGDYDFSQIAGILSVAQGGTGTPTPSLIAGANVTIEGSWPNQTVSGDAGVVLETNGLPNDNQETLNISGSGVYYGPPGSGKVTVSDGLIHGDTVWETDPAYFELRDDFGNYGASGTTLSTCGDTNSWTLTAEGSVVSLQAFGTPPHFGNVCWLGNTGAGAGAFLSLSNIGTSGNGAGYAGWALMEQPSWKATFIFQFLGYAPAQGSNAQITSPGLSHTSMYVGMDGDIPLASAAAKGRPYCFCGVRYDTDTTSPSIGDSTFVFECVANAQPASYTRNNTQGNTANTGITPTEGVWYRLVVTSTAAGEVLMTLTGDDGSYAQASLSMPSYTFSVSSGANASVVDNVARLTGMGSSVYVPAVWGSILNVTAGSDFTGAWSASGYPATSGESFWYAPQLTGKTYSGAASVTLYAGMFPVFSCVNDTTGGDQICFVVDFFSFVWNPGIAGLNSATANPSLTRYFA